MLLHGLRRRGDRLVLLLALVQLRARRRLDGSAVAAADAKTFAVPDAGARRSYGSTGVRANAQADSAAFVPANAVSDALADGSSVARADLTADVGALAAAKRKAHVITDVVAHAQTNSGADACALARSDA